MSRSKLLRIRDVKAAMRLIGELNELPPDHQTRTSHLSEGLLAMFHGQWMTFSDSQLDHTGKGGKMFFMSTTGDIDPRGAHAIYRLLMIEGEFDPAAEKMFEQTARRRRAGVWSRRQLGVEREWSLCRFFNEGVRPFGLDEYVAMGRPGPGEGEMFGFSIYRSLGAKRFSDRELALLNLLNGELGGYYRSTVARRPAELAGELSGRLRRTLEWLLAGESEKQIAVRLDLSPHTVHGYAKTLCRRFNVSGRAELMALHAPRN